MSEKQSEEVRAIAAEMEKWAEDILYRWVVVRSHVLQFAARLSATAEPQPCQRCATCGGTLGRSAVCGECHGLAEPQRETVETKHWWRGHEMACDDAGLWRYCDTGQLVSEDPNRDCGHCGLPNTDEGHDGCLGEIPGAANACCGHGIARDAYVQMEASLPATVPGEVWVGVRGYPAPLASDQRVQFVPPTPEQQNGWGWRLVSMEPIHGAPTQDSADAVKEAGYEPGGAYQAGPTAAAIARARDAFGGKHDDLSYQAGYEFDKASFFRAAAQQGVTMEVRIHFYRAYDPCCLELNAGVKCQMTLDAESFAGCEPLPPEVELANDIPSEEP